MTSLIKKETMLFNIILSLITEIVKCRIYEHHVTDNEVTQEKRSVHIGLYMYMTTI